MVLQFQVLMSSIELDRILEMDCISANGIGAEGNGTTIWWVWPTLRIATDLPAFQPQSLSLFHVACVDLYANTVS